MLEAIIRRVPFFASLPPRHLRWLAETLQPLDVLAGSVLAAEGDPADVFYIIIQGQLEVVKALEGGEELIARRGPGDYIAEMSLLYPEGMPRARVRAVEDSELLLMSRSDFDALLHRHPASGYELARVLCAQLEEAHVREASRLQERNRALQAELDELRRQLDELRGA